MSCLSSETELVPKRTDANDEETDDACRQPLLASYFNKLSATRKRTCNLTLTFLVVLVSCIIPGIDFTSDVFIAVPAYHGAGRFEELTLQLAIMIISQILGFLLYCRHVDLWRQLDPMPFVARALIMFWICALYSLAPFMVTFMAIIAYVQDDDTTLERCQEALPAIAGSELFESLGGLLQQTKSYTIDGVDIAVSLSLSVLGAVKSAVVRDTQETYYALVRIMHSANINGEHESIHFMIRGPLEALWNHAGLVALLGLFRFCEIVASVGCLVHFSVACANLSENFSPFARFVVASVLFVIAQQLCFAMLAIKKGDIMSNAYLIPICVFFIPEPILDSHSQLVLDYTIKLMAQLVATLAMLRLDPPPYCNPWHSCRKQWLSITSAATIFCMWPTLLVLRCLSHQHGLERAEEEGRNVGRALKEGGRALPVQIAKKHARHPQLDVFKRALFQELGWRRGDEMILRIDWSQWHRAAFLSSLDAVVDRLFINCEGDALCLRRSNAQELLPIIAQSEELQQMLGAEELNSLVNASLKARNSHWFFRTFYPKQIFESLRHAIPVITHFHDALTRGGTQTALRNEMIAFQMAVYINKLQVKSLAVGLDDHITDDGLKAIAQFLPKCLLSITIRFQNGNKVTDGGFHFLIQHIPNSLESLTMDYSDSGVAAMPAQRKLVADQLKLVADHIPRGMKFWCVKLGSLWIDETTARELKIKFPEVIIDSYFDARPN